jgi:hypothetical protein
VRHLADGIHLDAYFAGEEPATPVVRTLARAALALDAVMMARILARSIGAVGVVDSWSHVIRPVFGALRRLPDDTGLTIAVERLLGRAVFEAFAAVPRPGPEVPARVLLACAEGEQDSLALEALAAALAEAGRSCCSLGAATPHQALRRAVHRIRPTVTVVWSQTAATADPVQLRPPLNRHPAGALVAAGPGWATCDLPAGIDRRDDLTGAVSSILDAVRTEGSRSPAAWERTVTGQ